MEKTVMLIALTSHTSQTVTKKSTVRPSIWEPRYWESAHLWFSPGQWWITDNGVGFWVEDCDYFIDIVFVNGLLLKYGAITKFTNDQNTWRGLRWCNLALKIPKALVSTFFKTITQIRCVLKMLATETRDTVCDQYIFYLILLFIQCC
jgi:hypothetical protein